MADEADMRNELSDLQTRADQIADEVQWKTHTQTCVHLAEDAYMLTHMHTKALMICIVMMKRKILYYTIFIRVTE